MQKKNKKKKNNMTMALSNLLEAYMVMPEVDPDFVMGEGSTSKGTTSQNGANNG